MVVYMNPLDTEGSKLNFGSGGLGILADGLGFRAKLEPPIPRKMMIKFLNERYMHDELNT